MVLLDLAFLESGSAVQSSLDGKINMAHMKEVRFIIGCLLGAIGTALMGYLIPNAIYAYHWAISSLALLASAVFAFSLYFTDYELEAPIRLRFFLQSYLIAMVCTFLAPSSLAVVAEFIPPVGRALKIFPLLAAFVAVVSTYVRGLPVFVNAHTRLK